MAWHSGSCHCRAVRFEVEAPAEVTVQECNCSMCRMTGFLHLIVPRSRFRLLSGAEVLSEYTFNTRTAKHRFCSVCGVKAFYIPRSNPDGYSVNMRCLERGGFDLITIEPFDGENWEQNGERLRDLSR